MTVAIALQVHDGVVLASDSAGTVSITPPGGTPVLFNVYNNANKIFNLVKGQPIGAVTYGIGNFGSSSISTLAKDLRRRFSGKDKLRLDWTLDPEVFTIEEVAVKARKFLYEEIFQPLNLGAPGLQFGLLVAGYSAHAQLSEVWSIEIRDGNCPDPTIVLAQGDANVRVGGDPDVFCRIANGFSPLLEAELVNAGLDPVAVQTAMPAVSQNLAVPLVVAPMPIQDAIDLAEFFVRTTSDFARFKQGAATVGGPCESAAITKHEGFKWVRRKHYFNEELNPGEL